MLLLALGFIHAILTQQTVKSWYTIAETSKYSVNVSKLLDLNCKVCQCIVKNNFNHFSVTYYL
jgi:hypothetical protein